MPRPFNPTPDMYGRGVAIDVTVREAESYISLAAAVAEVPTGQVRTIIIERNEVVSADLTIPSNVELRFDSGGMISPATGITVTINGGIDAGVYQVFGGAGTVSVSGLSNKTVIGEWFSTPAIAKAAAKGKRLRFEDSPVKVSSFELAEAGIVAHSKVSDGVLFICEYTREKISAWSLEDPENPRQISRWSTTYGNPRNLDVCGGLLVISCVDDRYIEVWNVKDPYNPVYVGAALVGAYLPRGIAIVDDHVYTVSSVGIHDYIVRDWDTADGTIERQREVSLEASEFLSLKHNGLGRLAAVNSDDNVYIIDAESLDFEYLNIPDAGFSTCQWYTQNLLLATSRDTDELYVIDTEPGSMSVLAVVASSPKPAGIVVVDYDCYVMHNNDEGEVSYLDAYDFTDASNPYLYKSLALAPGGAAFGSYHAGYLYVTGHFAPYQVDIVSVSPGRENPHMIDRKDYLGPVTGTGAVVKSRYPHLRAMDSVDGFEHITNGSFDTDADGWDVSHATLASVAGGIGGTNCLEFTGTGGSQRVYQEIALVVGRHYTVMCYVKGGTLPTDAHQLQIRDTSNVVLESVEVDTSAQWQTLIIGFVATELDGYIAIERQTTNSGTILIDSVSLVETAAFIQGHATFANRATGQATITSASTSVVVTHGLEGIPNRFSITWLQQATNDYGRWWIDTIGETSFTVNVSADPGASNLDFCWIASIE